MLLGRFAIVALSRPINVQTYLLTCHSLYETVFIHPISFNATASPRDLISICNMTFRLLIHCKLFAVN